MVSGRTRVYVDDMEGDDEVLMGCRETDFRMNKP